MTYKSIYGSDKELTAAQYLAEAICKKCADRKKTILPNKFWTLEKYGWWKKKIYQENLAANRLLKAYSFEAVIAALGDPKAYWIQSLMNKDLIPIIEEQEDRLAVKKIQDSLKGKVEQKDTLNLPMRKQTGKKSKFSKLKD